MKKIWISALAVALTTATALAPHASAQAGTCKTSVAVDTVFQVGTSAGKYEYFIQVRNMKQGTTAVTFEFGEFPKAVILFSRTLTNVTLKPYESQKIRFGVGTDGQINPSTVKIYYDDRMSLPKPYVLAMRCSTIATK